MPVDSAVPPAVPAPSPRPRGARRSVPVVALLLATAPLAAAPGARADDGYASGRAYAELQAGGGNVRVGELQFYPLLGGVTVGAYVRDGIGLELHAEGGIDVDDDGGFELGLVGAAGASLRLESPPMRGTSGYVTLGYAVWTLAQEPEGGGREIEEDFTGPRVSLGLVQRLERVPALSVSAEFRTWYTEDGLDMTALLLGLRLSGP